jgi:DNA-binding CsgD family transcriptional regulator
MGCCFKNNIASLHNELGNYSDALFHASRFIERCSADNKYIRSLALYNALSASVMLSKEEDAHQYFEKIDKSNLFSGQESFCLDILLKYTVFIDDLDWFGFIAVKHKDHIFNIDSTEQVILPFVLLARLFLLDLETEFLTLYEVFKSDIHAIGDQYFSSTLDQSLQTKYDRINRQRNVLKWMLTGLAILNIVVIIIYTTARVYEGYKRKRVIKKINLYLSDKKDIQKIKSALVKGRSGIVALDALIRLDGLLSKIQSDALSKIPVEHLTTREQMLIKLTMSGKTPYEIAQSFEVTIKHVYNIRSNVKQKLNIPQGHSLEDWLNKQTAV